MKNKFLALTLCLVTPVIQAFAGEEPTVRTAEQVITDFMRNWNIPGGAVAISKEGRMIYNRGFGFADQARTIPVTSSHRFRIASVSKPVTSVAVMKLAAEGYFSLDDKVFGQGRLIDDPYYVSVVSDRRIYSITVRHLLEHTAGWDRSRSTDGYSHSDPAFFPLHVTASENEPNPVGDSTIIRFSLRKGLHHKPGSRFAYSNVGYLVLGKIIEKVTGMAYEDYVSSALLEPLAIRDMALGRNASSLAREVEYSSPFYSESVYGNGRQVPSHYGGFNLEAMNAHGGWVATPADLVKFLLAVDGFDSSPDLLPKSTVEEMSRPSAANPQYAKGWQVNRKGNWWHTGSLDGTSAFVCRTAGGYTWAFLFNARADNSAQFWREFDRLPWNCIRLLDDAQQLDPPQELGYLPLPSVPVQANDGFGGSDAGRGYAKECYPPSAVMVQNSRKNLLKVIS
jgi:CubicO group peptidase (beta-lactamase class C family)